MMNLYLHNILLMFLIVLLDNILIYILKLPLKSMLKFKEKSSRQIIINKKYIKIINNKTL